MALLEGLRDQVVERADAWETVIEVARPARQYYQVG